MKSFLLQGDAFRFKECWGNRLKGDGDSLSWHDIEVYVDDMIAKSQTKEDHIVHLQKSFACLRNFKLRLNLAKSTFGVKFGKLLGDAFLFKE